MPDLIPIRRALLSVSDKTGLVEFARALHKEFKVELISTGGTARTLREAGLPVKDVSEVTGFPEMMDGRVKTLHPLIHGGLLALRDNAEHVAAMKSHNIAPIDLVCVNLYPFKQTIAKPNVSFEEAIENIDIGGPSMIRSAAKNHRFVLVVTSPDRYEKVLGDLREHGGSCCGKHRLKQAQRAFAHTAEYDAGIGAYLATQIDEKSSKPSTGSGPARHVESPHHGSVATAAPARDRSKPKLPLGQSMIAKRSRVRDEDVDAAMHQLLYDQAVAVRGTEAIVFRVEDGALSVITHIRPGESDAKIRNEAVDAFKQIVSNCLQANQDGVIEVDDADANGEAQYCLCTLLRSGDTVRFANAVVGRFASEQAAQAGLDAMRLLAVPSEFRAGARAEKQLPTQLNLSLQLKQSLRYGENPHQRAALYVDPSGETESASIATATQLHGKELSYINLLDADAALNCVREFAQPAACLVKHATPCGAASANDIATAFVNAYAGDPVAAFGGIVALNRPVDRTAAERIVEGQKFLEVIVAPGYAEDALELLKTRWKNVRLLSCGMGFHPMKSSVNIHSITGGFLVQEQDNLGLNEQEWKVVSARQPTAKELDALRSAWLICKHVKSNAIVIAKDNAAVGVGGGQVDRVGAARIAIEKAADRAKGGVAASDAFFPFADGPKLLLAAGVTAIIHPGGSVRDQETIDVVNAVDAAMIFTGARHFRH